MFCVWLAFAVEIGVAMTAELHFAWFTRYEPPASTVMTSLPSPSLGRVLYNTMAFDPRMDLEEPNFCKNFISDCKISYICRMECQQHTEKRIM